MTRFPKHLLMVLLFVCGVTTGVFATGDEKGKASPDSTDAAKPPSPKPAGSQVATLDFSFGHAIHNDTIDISLSRLSNRDKSAFWNTAEINMYHRDMTTFHDTVTYSIHDPANGQFFVLPVNGRITSGFGPRRLYGRSFHYGQDIDLETGDTVVAAMDGTVRIARYGGGYGNFVILCHKDGLETLYGHLSELMVVEGQTIRHGEPIGLGGSTGQSTGSHLHFEFRVFGEQINPAKVLDFTQAVPEKIEFHVDASWFNHLGGYTEPLYHMVVEGEDISVIAEQYSKSADEICELNEMELTTELKPGDIVRYQ